MTRDEIVEVMARSLSNSLTWDIEADVLAWELTREEQHKVCADILHALNQAGLQIVVGEPVAWRYDRKSDAWPAAPTPIYSVRWAIDDPARPFWTETPLFAGKETAT